MTQSYATYKKLTSYTIIQVATKQKDGKKVYHAVINQKRTEVAINIRQTSEQRKSPDSEGHFIMIKVSIYQKDIATLNLYASNSRASKYVNLKNLRKLKGEIDKSTIIFGDFYTALSTIGRIA